MAALLEVVEQKSALVEQGNHDSPKETQSKIFMQQSSERTK